MERHQVWKPGLSISGTPGESHDSVVPGTLFLLYEESFGIKNDLQDKTTLNSLYYLVLHTNEY